MDVNRKQVWFLGANSPGGFASLYPQFTAPDRGRFFILKGGPGCGKSTFMRAVSSAAAAEGLAVEEIRCSGDPDSLDGVYIPAWHLGYVDGTAPHILEPVCPGGSELYLNFSAFYDGEALSQKQSELAAAFRRYRTQYALAYKWLAAAGSVHSAAAASCHTPETEQAVGKRARSIARRYLRSPSDDPGMTRYLSALTGDGRITLWSTAQALADTVFTLDNAFGFAPVFLSELQKAAESRGIHPVVCPDPMAPDQPEHLIFPSHRIAFLSVTPKTPYPGTQSRHIRLDAMVPAELVRQNRPAFRRAAKLRDSLLQEAFAALREANRLHGELESQYRPHTDFAALDRFTAEHLTTLQRST